MIVVEKPHIDLSAARHYRNEVNYEHGCIVVKPGDQIADRYEIRHRIGRGGFGTVYEAVDTQLNRVVAVKVLDKQSRTENDTLRFKQEAVVAAQINHPNVVTIHDVGVSKDDVLYIVMQRLEGVSLADHLSSCGFVPAETGLPHIIHCLEGLAEGHALGIVHKDLKPANLFITNPHTPKERMHVIDFGVARLVHDERMTSTGRIVGTPRYLAPEYISKTQVSPQIDVYQMALLLVELLSGHPCIPRDEGQMQACERHMSGALEIPEFIKRSELHPIVTKALSVDPANRYRDGAEFAQALRGINLTEMSLSQPTIGIPTNVKGTDPTPPTRLLPIRPESVSDPARKPSPKPNTKTAAEKVQPLARLEPGPTETSAASETTSWVPVALVTLVVGILIGGVIFMATRKPMKNTSTAEETTVAADAVPKTQPAAKTDP